MLVYMRHKAERAVVALELAVDEAASATEVEAAESAERLMQSAQAELAWQRRKQHELDEYDIVLMDGAEPYTLDRGGRLYNLELRQDM